MQLATADSPFPLLAAFGTVTSGERADAKTRVRGISLAAGTGAWAIGFQAWEGTRENCTPTTNSWWDASSFGFTGREHDLDSGLVYARARYLNPSTGRWDRADPVGQVGGPNYYLYAGSNPIAHSDPSGLMFSNTVDAYAVLYTFAFLMLLVDLGYTNLERTVADYDSRSRLQRKISTSGRRQPQPFPQSLGPDVFCQPTPEQEDPWVVYFRGLSSRDLGEFQLFQVVLSNYQRDGGTIADGLIAALDPETPARHILSGSAGSPLVSVTTDLDVARRFANSGPNASGVVIKFETRRLPMWSGQMQDSELLFFWQLGFDGERLSIYN